MQVPDCRYPTVMQMVDIEDVDVTNVLIDTCGMESVLLIEKNSEARRVMDHQRPTKANRVRGRGPRECVMCMYTELIDLIMNYDIIGGQCE